MSVAEGTHEHSLYIWEPHMSLVRVLNPRSWLTPGGYHNRHRVQRSGLYSYGQERTQRLACVKTEIKFLVPLKADILIWGLF